MIVDVYAFGEKFSYHVGQNCLRAQVFDEGGYPSVVIKLDEKTSVEYHGVPYSIITTK